MRWGKRHTAMPILQLTRRFNRLHLLRRDHSIALWTMRGAADGDRAGQRSKVRDSWNAGKPERLIY
jgi:hypothetical protein